MASKQIVVFKLQDQEYSVDIMKVLEIENYEPITSVPVVPDYIEGIINVRGTVYPIINLRTRLNMLKKECLAESKIILMNMEDKKVGFMVDSVTEILTIEEDAIEKRPKMLEENQTKYIQGIIKKEDKMIIILNVDALLSEEEVFEELEA